MPTYEYACKKCGEHLEVVQSFSDAPLTKCPGCKGQLRKVFAPVGITFKGSGFYKTDSRPRSKDSSSAGSSRGESSSGSANGSSSGSGDSGAASKSDSASGGSSGSSGTSSGSSGSPGSSEKSSGPGSGKGTKAPAAP